MKRRTVLAGLGATVANYSLPAPSLAQSKKANTLVQVPVAGLLVLDPVATTISITNYHGHHAYETLYAIDSKFRAKPQMAEGHTVSDDNLTWNVKLRPGLKFHDGERVLARDCVASIKRWGQRDGFGASLLAYSNEISAVDDNTIRFRLKKPFGVLPDALAHPIASACFIMPERFAATDITKPVTEVVGSGPFRFVADEFVPSQRAVYAKNTAYVPRDEKPDCMAGGKIVHFDRVEWHTISDPGTAAAALQAGEIDWWETVQFDLVEVLKSDKNIKVLTSDLWRNFIRFNCGQAPFNNPALRRAVAAGITQSDFNQALVGTDADLQTTCFSMYSCGLPGVEELGKGVMDNKKDWKALAEQVKKAGYNGEKVVLLNTADLAVLAPMGPVLVDTLTKMGIKVDLQMSDLGTISQRWLSQAPLDQGGWSMFLFRGGTPLMANPLTATVARGLGPTGFPGNNTDQELEADISEWIAAPTEQERATKLDKVHRRLWDTMPIAPMAGYNQQTAFRSNLTGYIQMTTPVAWNIRRI